MRIYWVDLITIVLMVFGSGYVCYWKGYNKRIKELETNFEFEKEKEEVK